MHIESEKRSHFLVELSVNRHSERIVQSQVKQSAYTLGL